MSHSFETGHANPKNRRELPRFWPRNCGLAGLRSLCQPDMQGTQGKSSKNLKDQEDKKKEKKGEKTFIFLTTNINKKEKRKKKGEGKLQDVMKLHANLFQG